MGRKRSWTDEELIIAVAKFKSVASVIKALGLVPAGGNYEQIQRRIAELRLSTVHFTGMGWNVGLGFVPNPPKSLDELLVENSSAQSHKLKRRLIAAGIKQAKCELCGWAEMSEDGRIPVELDHINGKHHDNRLENLRVLCPNCHSLQLTHRGRNKRVRLVKLIIQ